MQHLKYIVHLRYCFKAGKIYCYWGKALLYKFFYARLCTSFSMDKGNVELKIFQVMKKTQEITIVIKGGPVMFYGRIL